MFKDKNLVTKASNGLLIFMFAIMLLSAISVITVLISGDTSLIKGYTKSDYIYNAIVSIIYILFSGAAMFVLNKKINLYKDEYAVSKQVFNLFFMVAMLGTVISIFALVTGYIVYKEFSFYSLLALLTEAGIFVFAYKYLLNKTLLSKENTKKTNILNLIVIFLLIEYCTGVLKVLLQLIFGINKTMDSVKYILLYLVGIGVVILAYKMFSKAKDKEIVEDKKEVKVLNTVTTEVKPKTTKKKVTSAKKTTSKKKTTTKKKSTNKETKK